MGETIKRNWLTAVLSVFVLAAGFSLSAVQPTSAMDSCANDPCQVGSEDCGGDCFCQNGLCMLNGMCDDMPCVGEAPNKNCDFSNEECHCNQTLGKCVARIEM